MPFLRKKTESYSDRVISVTSRQPYNGSTIVNYDSRGVPD